MNQFEAFGIEHLSPSSCNLFAASPAMFVLEKCLKKRGPVGAAAHRGTAVEHGIVHGLMTGADDAECCREGNAKFSSLTAISGDPRVDREGESVAAMITTGLSELRAYGKPTATQGRVEYYVQGLKVPIIGYFDLEWQNHKILTDIKSTHALPSKVKLSHARQVALYHATRGYDLDPRLTYVTPKKVATYRLENPAEHLQALTRIAFSVQKFLQISADPMELASLVAPDVESFYFADPMTRQMAFEVWGV